MPTGSTPVHIALLNDHRLISHRIRCLLQELPYVEHLREAATLSELLGICRERLPDLLLLDLQTPGPEGPDTIKLLLAEFSDLKIIVLSTFSTEPFITQLMRLGARSYLPSDTDQQQLRQAVEDVLATGHHFTPVISRALVRSIQQPARVGSAPRTSAAVQLTPREHEILQLICEGHTAAAIADQLLISRRTVEGHRQKLLEKTSAPNSAGLVIYAVRYGLLDAS